MKATEYERQNTVLRAENAALRVKLETAGTYEDAYESGYQAGMEEKKPWVGLTDEEVGGLTVFDGLHYIETPLLAEYIRHIETKLKEKNGG